MSQVEIVVSGALFAHWGFRPLGPALEDMIHETQCELLVLTYILTDSSWEWLTQMQQTAERGVDVRLVVGDLTNAGHRVRALLEAWRRVGRPVVRPFPSRETLLHAKVLVSDRRVAFIGSANLTWTGSVTNHEVGVIVRVSEQVSALATMIERLTETLPAR